MEPIRYGIVGTGMMGIEHIANLRALDGAEVVAVADPDEGSARAATAAAPGATVFTRHRDLLASGLCDAIVVAVPNYLHHEVLLDIAAHDVHFLTEKPLCITVEQCREVIAATAGSDRVKWMGLEYRYKPALARLLEVVGGGAVGDVKMIAIREHRFPFLSKVADWNRFRSTTGGTLVEKCCHFFDLMNLVAASPPVRVMASGAQDVNHLDEVYEGRVPDILDNAYVIVEYASGVRASLDLCMFAESGPWEQEVSVAGSSGKVEAFVPLGSAGGFGTIRIGRRADGIVEEGAVEAAEIPYLGLHSGASYLEHVGFLRAIRTGAEANVTLEDGLLSVAVAVAAHLSIDEGRPVEVADVMGVDR